jgi:DNA-binding response OmpR family regulator
MSKSILSVSNDAMLLTTRSMLLKGEGYCVVSALGFEQAVAQCKAGKFDLLLLGHTISYVDKRELIKIFHEHCKAPVLVLSRPGYPTPAEAEYHSLSDSPEFLMDKVRQILSQPAKK